ncbi:MAG: homoserine dehydrogenase [Candidatus Marinimicrobia bacterium]|nr:homoserine dehydrogenase [Candidatus Neomarinimicrobiota bacterium]
MKKIQIGIIGCGAMGKGLLYQASIHSEIQCVAISDLKIETCVNFLERLELPYKIVNSLAEMHQAVSENKIAATEKSELIPKCETIDAVVEASSSIIEGGNYAVSALENGKHLVLMNAEIDLLYGPYLVQLSREKNMIYTSIDGDQYGVIKHLIDDLQNWGFELVMAGNIKGYLDRYANPRMIIPEADKRNLDYKMCTSYTDGTKLNIEMALLANAYGMQTALPGMYGPPANHVSEVFDLFDFDHLWKDKIPVVDYVLGAKPDGGVFAVGYCDHPYQREMLKYYKMGNGPYYLLYRPYHLCHIEGMSTIVEAVRHQKILLQPIRGFQANVFAYAKRSLKAGTKLDGLGGFECYGMIENCADQKNHPGLPICLADDVILKRDVEKDEKINMADILIPKNRSDFALFKKAVKASANIKKGIF